MAGGIQLSIGNSTAEFLVFQVENQEDEIQVYFQDETVWLTQKVMAKLFDVSVPAVNQHLKNIYDSGELKEVSTIKKNLIVRKEAKVFAETEFEKYRIIQDRLLKSDFELFVSELPFETDSTT